MPRRTVAGRAELTGTGLFGGRPCGVTVAPGLAGQGIRFRTSEAASASMTAEAANRKSAARRTVLAIDGLRIETVEHFLAAASAMGYDDLDVTVTGGELPIGDGSFIPFVELLERAGTSDLPGSRRWLTLDQPVRVECGEARYHIAPDASLRVEVALEYSQPVIGHQRFGLEVSASGFRHEIAGARTFGFLADIERAQSGGHLAGAVDGTGIALEPDRVVNTMLRWPDEFVRHKVGDLIGDLALLGARAQVAVTAVRPSHEGNFACVQALLDGARYREE